MKLQQSGAWRVVLLVAIALPALLVARFAWTFEVFGLPVHSMQHGWLGPTPRDAARCVQDIGKVNDWTCEDVSVFEAHRFGARLWLEANGL